MLEVTISVQLRLALSRTNHHTNMVLIKMRNTKTHILLIDMGLTIREILSAQRNAKLMSAHAHAAGGLGTQAASDTAEVVRFG